MSDIEAVGTASGECERAEDLWELVEKALYELEYEAEFKASDYPADVEVIVRAE